MDHYSGKSTAYLDQNILDILRKHNPRGFKDELLEKYQIVYSDETLKEIKRSGENYKDFLKILQELKAYHLKVCINEDFTPRGDAIIADRDPFDTYIEYCENLALVYENIQEATASSLFKFYGGNSNQSFDDINKLQSKSFEGLLKYISEQTEEFEYMFPDLAEDIKQSLGKMQQSFDYALNQSALEMKKHVENDRNWSGVKRYRDTTGIGPVQLNNIKLPKVIEQIWEFHKSLELYREFSIEQFLGISKNPIYHFREMHLFEKVTSAYNVLNVVGYYPDSKMKNKKRFTAAMSDAGHASMASFCDIVLSADSAFINKTRAVYEFLNVRTQVISVKVNIVNAVQQVNPDDFDDLIE